MSRKDTEINDKNFAHPAQLRGRSRTLAAFKMRLDGASFTEIARELGYSTESGARMAVKKELDRLNSMTAEEAELYRKMEIERCGEMFNAVFAKARTGDEKSINLALKIQEKIDKYMGLEFGAKAGGRGSDPVKIELVDYAGSSGEKESPANKINP